jgi:hypothetical protein
MKHIIANMAVVSSSKKSSQHKSIKRNILINRESIKSHYHLSDESTPMMKGAGVDNRSNITFTSGSVVSSESLQDPLAISQSDEETCDVPQKKRVSFHSIQIREHSRDVDVNPSVSSGPAVGLGWEYQDHPSYDLITFEDCRPPRRSRSEFQLPRNIREQLLQDHGVSKSEISSAIRSINVAKRQRQASYAGQEAEAAHLAMEWLSGKVKKIVGKRLSYKKEEQKLWEEAERRVKSNMRIALYP